MDGHGEAQKIGTDFQSGLLGLPVVDLKADVTDVIVHDDKIDDAAGLNKSVGLAHGQNAFVAHDAENFGEMILFRRADEQHLAIGRFVRSLKGFELQRVAVDDFVLDGLLQIVAENILPQHADDDGRIGRGKRLRRPFDEFHEIINEGRFDLVFRRRVLRAAK